MNVTELVYVYDLKSYDHRSYGFDPHHSYIKLCSAQTYLYTYLYVGLTLRLAVRMYKHVRVYGKRVQVYGYKGNS